MADLDVSNNLDDPDFWTDLVVLNTLVTIGPDGIAATLKDGSPFTGVVIPDGGRDLIQAGEGDAVQGDITIYTRYPLTTGDANRGADIVGWPVDQPDPYRVIQAQPWRYGSGYTRAVCKLATLNASSLAPMPNAGFLGP